MTTISYLEQFQQKLVGIGLTKLAVELQNIIEAAKQVPIVGMADYMPGTNGFTVCVFNADEIPRGTNLYAEPFIKTLQNECVNCIDYEPSGAVTKSVFDVIKKNKIERRARDHIDQYDGDYNLECDLKKLFTNPPLSAATAKDSERYQWLRNGGKDLGGEVFMYGYSPKGLDESIDEAMKASNVQE